MSLRPLSDFVAVWAPAGEARHAAAARVEHCDGVLLATNPEGWCLGARPLPKTALTTVYSPVHSVFVAQGADSLRLDAPNGHWQRLADDLLRETGFAANQTSADVAAVRFSGDGAFGVIWTHGVLMPLYCVDDGAVRTLSTSLDLLVAARPVASRMDRLIAASWANRTPVWVPGRSLLSGVRQVARGSRVRAAPGQVPRTDDATREFLGEEGANAELGPDDTAAWFREIVLANLQRDLDDAGPNLLGLSCGRDSSTLARVVNHTLRRPLATVSILPPHPKRRAFELGFAAAALNGVPENRRVVLDWVHKGYQTEVLAKAPSLVQPILHPVLCEMGEVLSRLPERPAVYFGGEFCDELIGGDAVLDEWSEELGLWQALRRLPIPAQQRQLTWRSLLRSRHYGLDRLIRRVRRRPDPGSLPNYFAPDVRAEYAELRATMERDYSRGSPAARWQRRWQHHYQPSVDMNWSACAHFGIRRVYPFVSREVFRLLQGTPAAHRLHQQSKFLLVQGFTALAPQELAERDKGSISRYTPDAPTHRAIEWVDKAGAMSALMSGDCRVRVRALPDCDGYQAATRIGGRLISTLNH